MPVYTVFFDTTAPNCKGIALAVVRAETDFHAARQLTTHSCMIVGPDKSEEQIKYVRRVCDRIETAGWRLADWLDGHVSYHQLIEDEAFLERCHKADPWRRA